MDFPIWAWVAFSLVLLGLLSVDLYVHRGHRHASRRSALAWTVVWIVAGLAFGGFVWALWGPDAALDYVAAYLIEKSLSLDNLFVFLVVFSTLRIPPDRQRIALTWGVLGALVFRALFVGLGVVALRRFEWVTWIFGALLLFAAWRALRHDPLAKTGESRIVAWLAHRLPVSNKLHEDRFLVRVDGQLLVTPLLLAVIALELTDILFAVDSVPAAFSITREPFLVYSSNAFAILGLRALYVVLARSIQRLRYLHYGLAAVLAFAGLKMVLDAWVHVPAPLSIALIALCIGLAVAASLRERRATREAGDEGPAPPWPQLAG